MTDHYVFASIRPHIEKVVKEMNTPIHYPLKLIYLQTIMDEFVIKLYTLQVIYWSSNINILCFREPQSSGAYASVCYIDVNSIRHSL